MSTVELNKHASHITAKALELMPGIPKQYADQLGALAADYIGRHVDPQYIPTSYVADGLDPDEDAEPEIVDCILTGMDELGHITFDQGKQFADYLQQYLQTTCNRSSCVAC